MLDSDSIGFEDHGGQPVRVPVVPFKYPGDEKRTDDEKQQSKADIDALCLEILSGVIDILDDPSTLRAGENIKILRHHLRKGLSQRSLAKQLGYTPARICQRLNAIRARIAALKQGARACENTPCASEAGPE